MFFSTKDNIIFDEEITLLDENVKNIYIDNRVRLIIHKDTDLIDVFFASYQKQGGLCYNNIGFSPKEYNDFKNINNLVQKILIEGEYSDYGIGIATEVKSKDAHKLLEKENEYSVEI